MSLCIDQYVTLHCKSEKDAKNIVKFFKELQKLQKTTIGLGPHINMILAGVQICEFYFKKSIWTSKKSNKKTVKVIHFCPINDTGFYGTNVQFWNLFLGEKGPCGKIEMLAFVEDARIYGFEKEAGDEWRSCYVDMEKFFEEFIEEDAENDEEEKAWYDEDVIAAALESANWEYTLEPK